MAKRPQGFTGSVLLEQDLRLHLQGCKPTPKRLAACMAMDAARQNHPGLAVPTLDAKLPQGPLHAVSYGRALGVLHACRGPCRVSSRV